MGNIDDRKFELNRLSNYSDDSLIEEIKRVAKIVGGNRLTKGGFNKHSKVHPSTVIRRFGSWNSGLTAAGLGHMYEGSSITDKMRQQNAKQLADKDLLDELRRISMQLGRKDLVVSDIDAHSNVGKNIFRSRFGTWKNALEKAGLSVRPQSRRYTDEECFENLYEIWKHYGRQPSFSEINKPPSIVGGQAYILRFGTWMRALEAFVQRANSNQQQIVDVEPHTNSLRAKNYGDQISTKSSRNIPWGLRFQVLRRDRFMCATCGRNPPQNPSCVLHVDHIVPWSKNGKTEADNLRTLCDQCNIGRGNRYSD